MKKITVFLLAILLLLSASACDLLNRDSEEPTPEPTPLAPTNHTIRFVNDTAYNFNRIYISPTASDLWGDELLGDTSILKAGGSFEVDIPIYDFNNYDIKILDEDNDEYIFMRVTLQDGYRVSINFGDEGLVADIYDQSGNAVSTVFGTLNGGEMQYEPDYGDYEYPATGYDTNGSFSFAIYNESDYEIYAIYIGPSGGAPEDDIDILPRTLPGGSNYTVEDSVPEEMWAITDWTFYVVDVDGDTSASYELFDLWTISYINVTWDSAAGGYVAEFVY